MTKINKKELLKIGEDVASLWGGSCIDASINKEEKEVVFDCIEHGERFCTTLTFDEIKEDYGFEI